jgi:hypothetical protein
MQNALKQIICLLLESVLTLTESTYERRKEKEGTMWQHFFVIAQAYRNQLLHFR